MRSLLLVAFFALSLASFPVLADPTSDNGGALTSATTPEEAMRTTPGKFVQDMGDHAIAAMADKSISEDQRMQQYREILRQSFDMKTIGHYVIGHAWNTATEDQRQEYMQLFEKLVLKTYGDKLSLYSGEQFKVRGVRQESPNDSMVNSEITHADGSAPTRVDWRVHDAGGGKLAIIDVIVAGVSQSVTQHDEYSSIIQRDGGRLDSLLDLMKKQVDQQ